MADLVLRDDADGVATLTLNRPDALNSLSPGLFVELRGHIDDLAAAADDVGVVVLRGAGRSFCAGNDLKAIQAGEKAPSRYFQAETVDALEALPQPVIVSVRGHCYTGGLELALAGDLLIAATDARFCDTHGTFAMVPTWGMHTRLPERVGPLVARDMMWSGRVVSGTEAAEVGLANRAVEDGDLDAATTAWAADIVASSWHTLRHEKRIMRRLADMGRADAIAWDRENSPGAGPDLAERISSGFGRR